jgi:hypothetical protein
VDEVTSALSRVGEFHVIARQSAVTLSNNPDIRAITQVLGADYLVEGSIQRVGDRVRIGAHLVDVQGHTIWSARYDESLDDLFELQDRIALQVAGQLPVKLRGAEIVRANSLVDGAGQARAWVLRALPHFWAHQRAENDHAIQLLSGALDVDRYDGRSLSDRFISGRRMPRPIETRRWRSPIGRPLGPIMILRRSWPSVQPSP